MRSTVLMAALNPILSILLVQRFCAPGAAAGTSLAFVISTIYLLLVFQRNYVLTSFRSILLEVYLVVFHRFTPQLVSWETVRYLVPIKMAADFGIFAPLYIVLLVTFRHVTAIDWNNFMGLISFSSEFLRHPFRERVKIYR